MTLARMVSVDGDGKRIQQIVVERMNGERISRGDMYSNDFKEILLRREQKIKPQERYRIKEMRNTKAWLCCDKNDPEERKRLVKPKREKKRGKTKVWKISSG